MGHHTSGKFTSEIPTITTTSTTFFLRKKMKVNKCNLNAAVNPVLTALILFYLSSALGGSHGVPRVHYKGRQGDYYVMVC